MPSYLAVVEDSAPFLTYTGTWRAGHSFRDDNTTRFSDSSYAESTVTGSAMSFEFYGNYAAVHGARRPNHGFFEGLVDGQIIVRENAFLPGPERQFQTVLFSANVSKGFHTIEIRNAEDKVRDVDFVSWQASVGGDDEPLIVNMIQDSHPGFFYEPAGAWTTQFPQVQTFSGGSGHGTAQVEAAVSLTFNGDAVAIYGPSGPNCAQLYQVQVDNRPVKTFTALRDEFRSKQLMYYGANLGRGNHLLKITLEASSQPNQFLAIDYAEIYSTPSLGASYTASGALVAATSTSPQIGLLVGLIITAILSALALSTLGYLFYLYKVGRIQSRPSRKMDIDSEFNVPMEPNPHMTAYIVPPSQDAHSLAGASGSQQHVTSLYGIPAGAAPPTASIYSFPTTAPSVQPVAQRLPTTGKAGLAASAHTRAQEEEAPPPAYPSGI
ncbi:hypothetical protein FA15DRAFT_695318 [Coprinopsis marcescibilis]|uniref:Transmembrane protein n=1 Tax=Coprinopsis marcescibilis TaxID=230819 RepID=A0A5C3KR85_COPMA|nr:hypothetical protein FA15DRAFT_695318 [Coprinopsis marcescibilis]